MKKIIVKLFLCEYRCECCGTNSECCAEITSENISNFKNTFLGNPHCTAMESVYFIDALKYILSELNLRMPYNIRTEKALKDVGDECADMLYEEGKINYRTHRRALNPSFQVLHGSTLEETAMKFMKENGYELEIKNEIKH